MDKQERRYTLEVTESQLRLIANCIEDCHRFASGQMELSNTLMHAASGKDKTSLREGLRELQPFLTPDLPMGSSYSWSGACCPNEEQKSFIARTYCLYREIYHKLRTLVKHDGDSVYDSPTLTCEEGGPLPRVELTKEKPGEIYVIIDFSHDIDDYNTNEKVVYVGYDEAAANSYFDKLYGNMTQRENDKWWYEYWLMAYKDGWRQPNETMEKPRLIRMANQGKLK